MILHCARDDCLLYEHHTGEMLSVRRPDVSYQTLTRYLDQKQYFSTWDKLSLNSEPVSEANKLEFIL